MIEFRLQLMEIFSVIGLLDGNPDKFNVEAAEILANEAMVMCVCIVFIHF